MALQSTIPASAVQIIFASAGPTGPSRWLATPAGRPHVPAAVVFAATHFQDEQLMFFLLAKAYEMRPSREAMLWIYQRFVKPEKVKGKVTVGDDFNDASRTVNIISTEADRCFELVTGAWARTMAGGAHPQAFRGALTSMANMLTDIDRHFQRASLPHAPAQYSAFPARVRLLDEELQRARQFNLLVS